MKTFSPQGADLLFGHRRCRNLKQSGQRRQIEHILHAPAVPHHSHHRGGDDRHYMVHAHPHGQGPGHLAGVQGDGAHHEGVDHC